MRRTAKGSGPQADRAGPRRATSGRATCGRAAQAGPPPAAPTPTPVSSGLPPWAIGIMAGAGILIIILLILLLSRSAPPPPVQAPPPELQAPAPPSPAPPPPATAPIPPAEAPAADLKEELQKVLSTLRDAQLKKDIAEFMSVYATSFAGSDQKRKETLESWQHYDYTTLVFTVDKVQALDPDHALAWVTWNMDIRNRNSQEMFSVTQSYQVRFVKEEGNWRIGELKEVE